MIFAKYCRLIDFRAIVSHLFPPGNIMPIYHFYSTDYERKTGGWIYNRHLIDWLDRHMGGVKEISVPVCFPVPDADVMIGVAALFDAIEPDSVLVMDHIYGCMLLPILRDRSFRLVLIYHHSMVEERGVAPLPIPPLDTGILDAECEGCAHPISPLEGEMPGRAEGGSSGANELPINLQYGSSPPSSFGPIVTSPPQGGRLAGARGADHSSVEKSALKLADAIIVTSDESQAYIATHYGIEQQKIVTAKPGNDPAPQSPAHDGGPWHMLSVGAVIPRKRYEFLVEALAAVRLDGGVPGAGVLPISPSSGEITGRSLQRPHRNWCLTIAGNTERYPDYVASLQNSIETHGLANHITLAGEVSTAALETLWSQTHLYVASSLYEGYGMAVSEALCRGIPVISTPSGAVASWAGEAAILVDADDPAEMAERMAAMMRDAEAYAGARKRAQDFAGSMLSWEESMALAGEGIGRLM